MNDSYGRVAAAIPANTDEAELYQVPTGMAFVGVLNICNETANTPAYSVALTLTSTAAITKDWLAFGISLEANIAHTMKVFLNAAQTIRIKSSAADEISFVLQGLLIDNR